MIKSTSAPVASAPRTNTTKKNIRGSSLLLIGRMVSLAINFAVQILIVRSLSKSDYGAFAYALSIVSMGTSIAIMGLDKAIARFVPIYEEQGEYHKLLGTIFMALGTIIGIGLTLVVLVFGLQGFLVGNVVDDPLSVSVLLILILLCPLQGLDNLFQGLFAVFANPIAIFWRRNVLGPGFKLVAVLIVLFTSGNVYMLAAGYLIGGLLGLLTYIAMFVRVMRERKLVEHLQWKKFQWPRREIFGFSIPLLTTDAVLILKSSMVVALLGYFADATAVATFQAVMPIAGLNVVALQSFKFLYTPLASRLYAKNDKAGINDLYWQTAVWITVISFPVFIATFALAQPVTILFFGDRYAESGIILAIVALGKYFDAAFGYNAYTLRVYGKVRYIVIIDILSGLISLAVSLWLIPIYGALGAAIGTTITLVAYNVLKHAGLLLGTGIDLFQWRYLKVYASIIISSVGLMFTQAYWEPSLVANIGLMTLISLAVVRLNRGTIDFLDMFPELGRVPGAKWFLRA